MKTGVEMIADERARQIADEDDRGEGWTPEHDDEHDDGELALAAICYATPVRIYTSESGFDFRDPWPARWDDQWDKRLNDEPEIRSPENYSPEERIDFLIKAGALIAAEIDRLGRAGVASHSWISRCADRYVEKSKCDRALAESMAASSLENLDGDLTEDPIEAADEDMSCWTE